MSTYLDQDWPAENLEHIHQCPYCGSQERKMAHEDVQDWSFYCAPGRWNYWGCVNCQSLYLDPRPTRSSIGLAYGKYYTHSTPEYFFSMQALKERMKNEWWSRKLNAEIGPRLHFPKLLRGLLPLIGDRVGVPFGWMELANWKKGRFIDVGSGSGQTVGIAQQLGWDAMGLEIDPVAVQVAQRNGLRVIEGTYEVLKDYAQQFDCIMCSHVLEHVHEPRDLLVKLKGAIKPGGVLLLSLPNALSSVRRFFEGNWRGLEAPRHLSIPSEPMLIQLLVELGFSVQSFSDNLMETAAGSYMIQRRGTIISKLDKTMARQLQIRPLETPSGNDLIKLICTVDVHEFK